jgi:hypothetical protein
VVGKGVLAADAAGVPITATTTIVGGAGVDTISVTSGAVATAGGLAEVKGTGAISITGGAGADVITLLTHGGNATIVLTGSVSSTLTTDVDNSVTGWLAATDRVDLTTNTAFKHGATPNTAYAEGALGNIANLVGLQVISNNITVAGANPTAAELQTFVGATEVFFVGNVDDAVYIAVDNGVDTWLVELQSSAANKLFTSAEDGYAVLMKRVGLADAMTLSAANFPDFGKWVNNRCSPCRVIKSNELPTLLALCVIDSCSVIDICELDFTARYFP